jgi:hypothetical protein
MVVEDKEQVAITMNGKKTHGRRLAIEFREKLFEEHFAMTREEQVDIVSDRFWDTVAQRAKKNTEIYREIFYCQPDDLIPEAEQVESFMNKIEKNPARLREIYDQKITGVKGHVVKYPLEFMSAEKSLSSPEFFDLGLAVAPKKIFT